jgi:4-amino-4-deoxy-L-arabinose transferase-like glycosyltransferase
MLLVYLAQGIFYSRTLVSTEGEESYLSLGYLALRGEISLYQDDITGQRLPLPFYLLGLSQVITGPDLWAGRLLSLALGLGVLALTVAVAWRIGGRGAALLAGFLLATQGTIIAYYATAHYDTISALILMAAVWILLKDEWGWRFPLGMAVASVLSVTRTTMMPAVPALFVWAWLGSPTLGQRATVVAVTALPPALFLLWDPTHLKLLAHVPLLGGLVEHLGYRSILHFQAVPQSDLPTQIWSLARFARRFESWALAAAGIGVATLFLRGRGWRRGFEGKGRALVAVGALGAWLLVWHFIMFRLNFKWAIAYFPDYAPLFAVVMGVVPTALWQRADLLRPARAVLAVTLAASLVVSVVFIRIPMMPTPVPRAFRNDSVQQIGRAADRLAALVPPGARLFYFGPPMAAHLAERRPYLQQLMAPGTFVPNDTDTRTMSRSGVWGRAEIERWLGREVGYAVVNPEHLDSYAAAGRAEGVARIRALLQERFEPIGRIDDAYWSVLEVYRRRPGEAGR